MSELIAVFIGILGGAAGYLISTFWFQPVLRYKAIRSQVMSDLVFYANVINAEGLNEEMKARLEARLIANRRHSADLAANFIDLPCFYKLYLKKRGENPDAAVEELMALSNIRDFEKADTIIDRIKDHLNIKLKVV